MILVAPYEVRTLISWDPWANIGIIATTVLVSIAAWFGGISEATLDWMILYRWNPAGFIGSLFLHADISHLLGNMLFLWVFGNAVNGVINQFVYLALYLILGLAGGALHLAVDGAPAIGASGAISGLLGLYVAVYPVNRIHCFWMFFIRFGVFDLPGYLLIGLWFIVQLFGVFGNDEGMAYWAHIGGFAAGLGLGIGLLRTGLVSLGEYDNPTLPDYFRKS